jgi:integrase
MATFRNRNGKCEAIVIRKKDGEVVFRESRTFDTPTLARSWAKRLEAELDRGGVTSRKTKVTKFGTLLENYMKARNEVKPMGRSMDHDFSLLIEYAGDKPLESLTAAFWSDFARKRRTQGAGPATVLHNLSTARAVLNAAKPMFNLDVSADPVSQAISALRVTGHVANSLKRDRRPSPEELAQLADYFEQSKHFPWSIIPMDKVVPLALAFPRRLSDLMEMEWRDYKGRTLTLRDTKHPTHTRDETVPVPSAARAIIEALPVIDARILPYNAASVSAAFARGCKKKRVEDLRFHDLRHEGICRLFEAGLTIPEVQLISGHLSWAALQRYTHLRPEQALDRIEAHARSQADKKAHTESA